MFLPFAIFFLLTTITSVSWVSLIATKDIKCSWSVGENLVCIFLITLVQLSKMTSSFIQIQALWYLTLQRFWLFASLVTISFTFHETSSLGHQAEVPVWKQNKTSQAEAQVQLRFIPDWPDLLRPTPALCADCSYFCIAKAQHQTGKGHLTQSFVQLMS